MLETFILIYGQVEVDGDKKNFTLVMESFHFLPAQYRSELNQFNSDEFHFSLWQKNELFVLSSVKLKFDPNRWTIQMRKKNSKSISQIQDDAN